MEPGGRGREKETAGRKVLGIGLRWHSARDKGGTAVPRLPSVGIGRPMLLEQKETGHVMVPTGPEVGTFSFKPLCGGRWKHLAPCLSPQEGCAINHPALAQPSLFLR